LAWGLSLSSGQTEKLRGHPKPKKVRKEKLIHLQCRREKRTGIKVDIEK